MKVKGFGDPVTTRALIIQLWGVMGRAKRNEINLGNLKQGKLVKLLMSKFVLQSAGQLYHCGLSQNWSEKYFKQ